MSGEPSSRSDEDPEREMEKADEANGEGVADGDAANDTEERYGEDESPA